MWRRIQANRPFDSPLHGLSKSDQYDASSLWMVEQCYAKEEQTQGGGWKDTLECALHIISGWVYMGTRAVRHALAQGPLVSFSPLFRSTPSTATKGRATEREGGMERDREREKKRRKTRIYIYIAIDIERQIELET